MWNNFKSLVISYAYNTILVWFGAFKKKKYQFRFISEKITSLADILQGKKPYSKIFSGRNFFIYKPIFKIFVALFTTSGMQNGDMVIFFLTSFRKMRFCLFVCVEA